jgi:hypothetical protein
MRRPTGVARWHGQASSTREDRQEHLVWSTEYCLCGATMRRGGNKRAETSAPSRQESTRCRQLVCWRSQQVWRQTGGSDLTGNSWPHAWSSRQGPFFSGKSMHIRRELAASHSWPAVQHAGKRTIRSTMGTTAIHAYSRRSGKATELRQLVELVCCASDYTLS